MTTVFSHLGNFVWNLYKALCKTLLSFSSRC